MPADRKAERRACLRAALLIANLVCRLFAVAVAQTKAATQRICRVAVTKCVTHFARELASGFLVDGARFRGVVVQGSLLLIPLRRVRASRDCPKGLIPISLIQPEKTRDGCAWIPRIDEQKTRVVPGEAAAMAPG